MLAVVTMEYYINTAILFDSPVEPNVRVKIITPSRPPAKISLPGVLCLKIARRDVCEGGKGTVT